MKLRTWLRPGMLIKRWIIMSFVGLVMTSLAMAMALAWLYRNYHFPDQLTGIVRTVTLQFVPHPYREIGMLIGGAVFALFGFFQLGRSLLAPFLTQRPAGQGLAEIIQTHRFGPAAPELRVVAVGGGTGLSTLLRGLKLHDIDITAIVTVGDDGGSSGRLRTEFNIPPPGDIRNCLVALADAESIMSELFQYRFGEGSSLDGHSFGNLFITALTRVSGSFEKAVVESSRVLAVRGQVLPSTLEDIEVCGQMADGRVILGESNITNEHGTIKRIFLNPPEPAAYDPAIIALLSADVIVLGPGSLYTSVLPNLLVPGIAHAISCSPAVKVYVCNVATQHGETDDFGAIDHVRALERHVGGHLIDYALVNSNIDPVAARIKPEWSVKAVGLEGLDELDGVRVLLRDVISAEQPLRHDPAKLASELLELARQARTAAAKSGESHDVGAGDEHEGVRQPVAVGMRMSGTPARKEGLR